MYGTKRGVVVHPFKDIIGNFIIRVFGKIEENIAILVSVLEIENQKVVINGIVKVDVGKTIVEDEVFEIEVNCIEGFL